MKKTFIALSIASLIASSSVLAETSQVYGKENTHLTAAGDYWTADRLKNAKPMPLPQIDPSLIVKTVKASHSTPFIVDGVAPTYKLAPNKKPLFKAQLQNLAPHDYGTRFDQFSSSQLVPVSADLVYPYTTIGRLYFTDPTRGDMYCTAAVINKRLIVTAGHCIHNGSGRQSGFYDNFTFIPAYRDGYAPFQTWNWSFAGVSSSWFNSNGQIPNEADYGMIELQNNYIDGSYRTVGSVTGTLGFQTVSLMPNHAHIVGYSFNFDNGQKMHQVTASSAGTATPNNVEYGSDLDYGSSGSPMVQNFGMRSDGQFGGKNPDFNRIIGVISWGTTAPGSLAEGASNPDSRFVDVYNKVCSHGVGNC